MIGSFNQCDISKHHESQHNEQKSEEEQLEKPLLMRREGEHRWSCLSMLVDASLALVEGDQAEANRILAEWDNCGLC